MKTICSRKRCGGMPALLLLLLLAIGCGSQDKGAVSGKVTYQGKPLSSGFVTFVPEKGAPVHSEIQSDGSYHMDKAPVGPVKISVHPKSEQETSQPAAMPRNPKDYGKQKAPTAEPGKEIPPKYADPSQSGLTYTVTKGSQQYDIVLK